MEVQAGTLVVRASERRPERPPASDGCRSVPASSAARRPSRERGKEVRSPISVPERPLRFGSSRFGSGAPISVRERPFRFRSARIGAGAPVCVPERPFRSASARLRPGAPVCVPECRGPCAAVRCRIGIGGRRMGRLGPSRQGFTGLRRGTSLAPPPFGWSPRSRRPRLRQPPPRPCWKLNARRSPSSGSRGSCARSSSGRTTCSTACSSACSRAATCSSKGCPGWPRRWPSRRSRRPSPSPSSASSSRPTCCRPTSSGR